MVSTCWVITGCAIDTIGAEVITRDCGAKVVPKEGPVAIVGPIDIDVIGRPAIELNMVASSGEGGIGVRR